MYMDGFHRTWNGNLVCLNLFFPGWTLDTKEKFIIGNVLVFVVAIAVEWISKFRRRIVLLAKKRASSITYNQSDRQWTTSLLRLAVTLIHGVQALLGYLLMLATMTFSVELFFAVVLGLATGYAIFFRHQEALNEHHMTSNPCCNFMEGEAWDLIPDSEDPTTTTTIPITDPSPVTSSTGRRPRMTSSRQEYVQF